MTTTFRSMADALRAGFQQYDRYVDTHNNVAGYTVRRKNASGLWEMALVIL